MGWFDGDAPRGPDRGAQMPYRAQQQAAGNWATGGRANSVDLLDQDPIFKNLDKGEAIAKRDKDFGLGSNNSPEAQQMINAANTTGQVYSDTFNGMADRNLQSSEDAANRGLAGFKGDTKQYQQGLANAQQSRGLQTGAYGQLMNFANQGPGASAAQAQLTQATDANTQNALALARSGRGMGGGAAALRQAIGQNATTQQQSAGQMAQLRANENTAYQAQKGNALNQAGALAGQIQAGDQGYGALGLQGAQYQTDTALKGTQLNDASAQNWATQAQNAAQLGLGAEVGAQTQALNVDATALAGRENEYASANSTYATEKGLAQAAAIADANRQQAYTGAALSTAGTVAGALSDERAKKNIQPLSTWGGGDDPVIADAFAQGLKVGAGALAPGKVRSTWGTGDDEYASAIVQRAKRDNMRGDAPAIKDAPSKFDPIAHSDMVRGEDQPYTFGDTQGQAEYWAPAQRKTGPRTLVNPENSPYLLSDERSKQDINPLGTPATLPPLGMPAPTNGATQQPDGSAAGKVGGPSLAQQEAASDERSGQTGQGVGKTAGAVVGGAAFGPVGAVAGNLIGGAIGKGIGKLLSDERTKQTVSPLTPGGKDGDPKDDDVDYAKMGKGIANAFGGLTARAEAAEDDGARQSMAIASRGAPAYLAPERYSNPVSSDVRGKEGVEPIDFSAEIAKRYPGIASSPKAVEQYASASPKALAKFSRSDHPILSEGDSLTSGGPLAESARQIPGYAYDYKNPEAPGAKAGRQVGPMAQDLAANPLTRGTVIKDRKGKLGVDTPRLTLYNTAAQHAQQSQLDELNSKIDGLAGLLKRKPSSEAPYSGLSRGTGGL